MIDSDDEGGDYAEVMAMSPVDIKEYSNSYAFVIDMPVLDPGDVRVQVKADNVLRISSQRRRVEEEGVKYLRTERLMGKFMRKFALPENANTGKMTTVFRNGVHVTVEKLLPPQSKTIKVKQEPLGSRVDAHKVRIGAVDRMSLLPNEILVYVLSLLSFKEATVTSILCRRWRYLHTFTAKLDFDGTKLLKARTRNYTGHVEQRRKYMSWVDGVVRLNQSSRLETFRVMFDLRGSDTQHMDEWIRFALHRKAESLELMCTWDTVGSKEEERYTLNFHKCNYDFNLMKKLSTHWVNVSGEAVEMLLRNCPLLEQLSIVESEQLLGLEIIKPFPSFRSLEIMLCRNLTSVVVDDSNIVNLKYSGKRVDLVVLVNVPLLSEIWIEGSCTDRVEDVVEMFSSVLPQLHTFRIHLFRTAGDLCSEFGSVVMPKMSNLKQLVVDLSDVSCNQDLLPLIDLIRGSPRLQTFVIEEPYQKDRVDNVVEVEPIEIPLATSTDRMILRAYPHFKEVKFVGYRGVSMHFELLKHLVENAIALETIVIDPWGVKEPFYTYSFDRIPRRKFNPQVFARANAFKDCSFRNKCQDHLVMNINIKLCLLEFTGLC